MKLYVDPGHGGTDPGAQGNGLNEKDLTLDIALKLQSILTNGYENIEIKLSRTSDVTKSLSQRTNEANSWGANYYLAIHINAANGSAQGYEDYIYSGLSNTSPTANYQTIIHAEVMKLNQLTDRGRKKANFHVLRESTMPAFLSENGFIDNAHDTALMKQASWRQNVAQGHANGLAKAFNLKAKATPPPAPSDPGAGALYRVIAGSFQTRENADERVTFLRSKGIDSFVNTTTLSGKTWFRVQAGAYSNRENAEKRLAEVKKAGIGDAFLVVENGGATPAESSSGNDNSTGGNNDNSGSGNSSDMTIGSNSIMGPTSLSGAQMNAYVKTINPNAPDLGNFYQNLGEYYGIRGDIAFAQAIHETNYFRFTGTVKTEQNNYAGIGATGGSQTGANFATPQEGVLAHLQHLYAYATTTPLPPQYPLVDPRFSLVTRGSAPRWIDLNGKWAVPGETYGQMILELYAKIVSHTIKNLQTILTELPS
ncbi:N-acetylmuramoyl-L-alanine amidase [Neobacillus jeddahensis]|uniref:N-acetylmuramoyl-L-alanine amidase n=1 Tax=Neobacillus jeddahensis TaxID=1461580 RepID=UPI00058E800A|nr:N-acetylmuramoyl-L-alanine amidase [Neobacillus jeddahensis]